MEAVVSVNPRHALAQSELGALALQMGDVDRARVAFEQAVAVRPDVPESHYQLGLAYGRLGFQDKARAQMAEFQRLRSAADRAKANGTTPAIPEAENKTTPRPR
jgi:Flp pilus assembly protein TadD